jgi:hypothetical protein
LNQQTSTFLLIILFAILLLVLAAMGSNYLLKRAMRAVIKALRVHNALTAETAQFAEDVGLKKKGLFQNNGLRDYKPMALDFLRKQEIVITTQEGKVFLSEEALSRTAFGTRIGIK